MRIFEDMNIKNKDMTVELFDCLPKRAKSMFFDALEYILVHRSEELPNFIMMWSDDYISCKSPIEKIFLLAFNIIYATRNNELPESVVALSALPQYEIETDNKRFYVDFYIICESSSGYKDVIVECDGHDFHEKTKKQVIYDNEREYAIKKAGYDILRFSGSQIYNNPFKCANDVFDYLLVKKEVEYSGDL